MPAIVRRMSALDGERDGPWAVTTAPRKRNLIALKVGVTIVLYLIVFYRIQFDGLIERLSSARLRFFVVAVAAYAAGQALSAYKWQILTRPVGLALAYPRAIAMYFIGMFFNIFLPTIVGGDAVKAVLLARHTGAPARSTMTVFMERNTGLLALLTIATAAAWFAPPVQLAGLPLFAVTALLFAAFIAANAALLSERLYRAVDFAIVRTPLARFRARAMSLYDALIPYTRALGTVTAAVLISFVFQAVVILVVFLNTRALDHPFPLSAIAVFVPLISLAGMLPISVNGLGVREALYLLLFGQLGAPPEVAVLLALLYFAVTLTASLPGGLLYMLQRERGASPLASRERQTEGRHP
jgi:uncharacterized protein (TIRG00374 family)